MKPGLTTRQKRFCQEYLIDYSPVNAMIRAGYAKLTANHRSGDMMRNPFVKEYLEKHAKKVAKNITIDADTVVKELGYMATANLADYYKYSEKKKKWVLKSLDELTPAQQRCISEYKPGEYIKLYNRNDALDKLAKHFKLYTEINTTNNNLFILPPIKRGGREVVFEVGRPAPDIKAIEHKTN